MTTAPPADELDALRRRLADLERRLADTERLASLGAWDLDMRSNHLYWSEEVFHMFGIPLGTTPTVELFYSTIHPDDLPGIQEAVQATIVSHTPYSLDLRVLRPDGEGRIINARGAAMLDAGGNLERLVGTVQDITRHHEATLALRASEERNRVLLSALPDPLMIYDAEGRVTYVNAAFERTFGWTNSEILGRRLDFVPEDRAADNRAALGRAQAGEALAGFETQRLTKGRDLLDVQISATALRNTDGSSAGLVIILRDITAQLRMQAELLSAQSSLISELSTPLMPISDEVMVMPLVGSIDSARAQQITERLLEGVAASRARAAIIDITGVPVVDTQVADAILRAAQAVKLLGATVVITGIGPEVAQTLVGIGLSLNGMVTRGTLQSGIAYAMKRG